MASGEEEPAPARVACRQGGPLPSPPRYAINSHLPMGATGSPAVSLGSTDSSGPAVIQVQLLTTVVRPIHSPLLLLLPQHAALLAEGGGGRAWRHDPQGPCGRWPARSPVGPAPSPPFAPLDGGFDEAHGAPHLQRCLLLDLSILQDLLGHLPHSLLALVQLLAPPLAVLMRLLLLVPSLLCGTCRQPLACPLRLLFLVTLPLPLGHLC
mmetsp:Transcript_136464/g.236780  ORF Transcript_136464/g.236780 Transcript_136464/m.236780 type:complete len:209 (-) Transcript_136464:389-1015(-)